MELKHVTDAAFKKYGRVIKGIDFSGLVEALNTKTPTRMMWYTSRPSRIWRHFRSMKS